MLKPHIIERMDAQTEKLEVFPVELISARIVVDGAKGDLAFAAHGTVLAVEPQGEPCAPVEAVPVFIGHTFRCFRLRDDGRGIRLFLAQLGEPVVSALPLQDMAEELSEFFPRSSINSTSRSATRAAAAVTSSSMFR